MLTHTTETVNTVNIIPDNQQGHMDLTPGIPNPPVRTEEALQIHQLLLRSMKTRPG